jgi:3D (Asp-Asp-Asp) domain-containing protein
MFSHIGGFSMTYEQIINKLSESRLGKLAKAVREEIKSDVDAIKQRDPAAKSDVEVLLLYSGLHAILAYRVAHKLYLGGHSFSARAISQLARFFTGIEIHPGATIGKGLVIDHGMGIVIGEGDEVKPSLNTAIREGSSIHVVLYDTHEVTVQEELAFTTQEIENLDLAPGERKVIQAGQKGIIEYVYNIKYENGVEISRQLVRENKLSDPVEEIVEYCPDSVWELGVVPASRPTNYTRVETFTATAYDASPADNGIWAGKTSTGMPLVYGVIAVDPRVIPYGTKMYIESADGQYKYGYAIAGDCGGAIKGKKVDLFFPNRSTCTQFGRRAVNIYFLD